KIDTIIASAGIIWATSSATTSVFFERNRNRDRASAAKNASTAASTTVDSVTTSDVVSAGRNSIVPDGWVTTFTKLSSVNWSGKKCGTCSRMARFGRSAEFTIQYTGKADATKTTTAATLSSTRTAAERGRPGASSRRLMTPPASGANGCSSPTGRA